MSVKSFNVSLRDYKIYNGVKRYLRVTVHETDEEMRKAAKKYRPMDGDDFVGCWQPAPNVQCYDKERHWWYEGPRSNFAGVMRLSQNYLSTVIVAHECTHAALTIFRMDVSPSVCIGDGYNPDTFKEEALCHIVGDLVGSVTNGLHDVGLWV